MAECMVFPEDWHDFLDDYSFVDSKEYYTNGTKLISVFRVEQLINHLLELQEPVEPVFERQFMTSIEIYDCGKCGTSLGAKGIAKYCMKCGRAVKWQ